MQQENAMTNKLHEAIVKAALESAKKAIMHDAQNTLNGVDEDSADICCNTIRHLASNPANVAAILEEAKKAGEGR
jgi:hypothetical protein